VNGSLRLVGDGVFRTDRTVLRADADDRRGGETAGPPRTGEEAGHERLPTQTTPTTPRWHADG
jgi:hypothetical protein